MTEHDSIPERSQEPLRVRLEMLAKEFGMRAVVDTLVDIDNAHWEDKLRHAQHLIRPNGPFTVQYDKATDFLKDI